MKQRAPGPGSRSLPRADVVDFGQVRCRRSHDQALRHIAMRLELVEETARDPLERCLEAAGVLIEILLHPPSGRALVRGVSPERLDLRHFVRLYELLTRRHLDSLHTDLLGELPATRPQLEAAVRQLFPSDTVPGGDAVDGLELVLDVRLAPATRGRIRATMNHLYASMLTSLTP